MKRLEMNFRMMTRIAVASVAIQLSGCVVMPYPAAQVGARYGVFYTGGVAIVQADMWDSPNCSSFVSSAVAKNPTLAGLIRCEIASRERELPAKASVTEASTRVPVSMNFRTNAICQKFLADARASSSGLSVVLPCSGG